MVVPTLRVEEVTILFAYVFARERYRPQEFPSLLKACRVLGVPLDRLPRELMQYSDDDQHVTGPVARKKKSAGLACTHIKLTAETVSTEEPMILPESTEVTPVETLKVVVAGKRRRGRPRQQQQIDKERGAKSSSSGSPPPPPPPPSKRTRGSREGKIVSYSSFGRPRRTTARSGAGPGEEMVSDDQRGKRG